jgi:hypothetical protein
MRLVDMRRIGLQQYAAIQEQLKDPTLTFEQRTVLNNQSIAILKELAGLQKVAIKKARKQREEKSKGKPGRPKKQFDSEGNPLYNDSPKMEEPNSKEAFLNRIQANGPEETENG